MPVSEEFRKKVLAIDSELAQEQGATEEEAARTMRERLAGAAPGSSAAHQSTVNGLMKTSEAVDRFRAALTGDEQSLVEVIRSRLEDPKHRDFFCLIKSMLESNGHAPRPNWFKPKSMFDADLDFGDSSCTITVATTGMKLNDSLGTRVIEIQQAIAHLEETLTGYQKVDEKTGEKVIDYAKVPANIIKERNDRIRELSVIQNIETIGGVIKSWRGPAFQYRVDTAIGGGRIAPAGSELRILRTLNLSREDDRQTAIAVWESLPQKAIDLITQGIRMLNAVGIESAFEMGNS